MAPPRQTLQNGRYLLQQRLGAGGFGEVWRGRDRAQDAEVAVKLLGAWVTLDEVLLEAQLLTRLRAHDRVATIFNVSLDPPRPFIVMEYLRNGSVEERLNAGQVSIVQAARWTREGLDALTHAHEMGVLHRDIKPANFLLDREERAVLSDFGIAEDTARNLLANSAIYGLHAAPEFFRGQPSSRATDIWAVGCTLYRLLTAGYPFADQAAILAGPPLDPHRLNPQVPLSLTRVVRKALEADPADRYGDARDMVSDLIDCHITNSWRQVPDPTAIEVWSAQAQEGAYELRVTRRRNGRYEVRARRDRGNGLRQVVRDDFDREAEARRVRRNFLVQVVEGRPL